MPASKLGFGAKNSCAPYHACTLCVMIWCAVAHRRQRAVAREILRRQHLQHAHVVQNPDAAAVRADDERVVARMNHQIVGRHRRKVREERERRPRPAVVGRKVHAPLVAKHEEVRDRSDARGCG